MHSHSVNGSNHDLTPCRSSPLVLIVCDTQVNSSLYMQAYTSSYTAQLNFRVPLSNNFFFKLTSVYQGILRGTLELIIPFSFLHDFF